MTWIEAAGARLTPANFGPMRGLRPILQALLQGAGVRLVMIENASPPPVAELTATPGAAIEAITPRFEDAFVALLEHRNAAIPALPSWGRHGAGGGGA